MTWGAKVEALTRGERQSGRPAKILDARPEVAADLGSIWEAFGILSAGRGLGVGMVAVPLPITFEATDAYARRFGPAEAEEFERFYRIIRHLDGIFLKEALKDKTKKDK